MTYKLCIVIVISVTLLLSCQSQIAIPTEPVVASPTLWCGFESCEGLLPYPTATQPPPVIDWTITLECVGSSASITYTYQDLTAIIGHGVSRVPSAMPDWVELPEDRSEWAGWEGLYMNQLIPENACSTPLTDTHFVFIADDGSSVRLDDPGRGNASLIALKNGEGEWLANVSDSPGPVRLIIIGRPIDLWIYRVNRIIVE